MSKIDWSKTPDAQFFVNGSFYKYDQGKWFWSSSDGIWVKTPYESPENFSWWGFRVEAPVAWNGEGLPPAGTVCELRNVAAGTAWAEATIVFASRNVIVWDWVGEPPINGLCTAYAHAVEMRPIRTPEQIAAEERAKAIDEMCEDCGYNGGGASYYTCAGLYDAGYRKQEPKPE